MREKTNYAKDRNLKKLYQRGDNNEEREVDKKKTGGRGQVILPPITEVMVSLGGEDIHMSNRSDNVRFRVPSKTVRRLSPSSVWLIAKRMTTPVIGARIRRKTGEDFPHTYCSRAVKNTSGSPSTHWHTPQRLLLGVGNAKA